ncbi:hypothetical protein KBW71_19260 [Hydrogenophaga aromaticivorans]|uniref:hypothetical protein n=1 Tax=Hydrogenophaga aromaticivorans TaxID=2610898 RepID=UPI0003F42015|nr:hypothetical protein [Hydrogenophaga aromaticivorans]EWS66452.1 hypothetical protein Y695_00275 [Hydrogenophaga sp. T4]MBQ0920576.1 hypothetical protein [Hydrogenophaga aromaticivorans]
MRIEYTTTEQLIHEAPREAPVIIAMPATDLELARRCAELMARRAGAPGLILVVMDEQRLGYIESANRAFRHSDSHYFIYVAQDAFAGRLWLRFALHQIEKQQKDMLAFNDGKWHGLLASFGMVRRSWAQTNYGGSIFHSSYHSHFGDAELTLLARAHDRLCFAPRSVLVEIDWDKDDKLVNDGDRKQFRQRAKTLFEGRVSSDQYCQIFPKKPLPAPSSTPDASGGR